jgi:MFS family permease
VTLRPERGLWQHSDFLKLWSAETVSQFGTQFSALALPLTAVIVLHASVFEIAALNVVEFLPFVLVSLPAGVWVDRLPRRPILVLGDLARAALLISIPVAYAFDALTIWQLYAVGFLVGIATVFFDVATSRICPRSSTGTSSSRGTRSWRSAARARSSAVRGLLGSSSTC